MIDNPLLLIAAAFAPPMIVLATIIRSRKDNLRREAEFRRRGAEIRNAYRIGYDEGFRHGKLHTMQELEIHIASLRRHVIARGHTDFKVTK